MQINATGPVSFQGLNFKLRGGRNENNSVDFTDKIKEAKEKAEKNIHAGTLVATSATGILAITKGRKCVELLTRACATIGETATKAAIKAGAGLASIGKKKKINPQGAIDKVGKVADKLRDKNPTVDQKFIDGAEKFVGDIFGETKGEKAKDFLVKNGLINPIKTTEAAAGGVLGLQVAGITGAKVEGQLDKRDMEKASGEKNTLGFLMDMAEGLA